VVPSIKGIFYLKYCTNCLATNLRPNSKFIDGVCLACKFSQDRETRPDVIFDKLVKILKSKKRRNHSPYDCIVGVSGGKDSLRQAKWVKDRLKLNPLLVSVSYPPSQLSETGAKNIENLISKNFDIIQMTPAPQTSCALSLQSFKKYGNVCKSTEIALFSGVPRIAIDLKVPLIFWGENPALQVGDSKTEGTSMLDGNNLRNLNTLVEGGTSWMNVLQNNKINSYLYPSKNEFEKNALQIIYLGAAWDDWNTFLNASLAALSGLTLRPSERHVTGDISEASMLDEEFTNINMMIKYYKFGFGRATDQLNEIIRSGKISRHEAISIAEEMDGICDDTIIQKYCDYVAINTEEFWNIVYKFVNWRLFKMSKNSRPKRNFKVGENKFD